MSPHHRGERRHGIAIVVVFVMIMLITLAAYRFSFVMQSEYRLAKLYDEQLNSRQAAWSGIEHANLLLDKPLASRPILSLLASEIDGDKNNLFRGELIPYNESQSSTDSINAAWQFVLIAPNRAVVANDNEEVGTVSDSKPGSEVWRWGLENESAKIPIQALKAWERSKPGHAKSVLSRLPGVKPESIEPWLIAEGIIKANRRIGAISNPTERSNETGDNSTQETLNTADPDNINSNLDSRSAETSSAQLQASYWSGGDLNQNYQLDPLEQIFLERQSRTEAGSSVRSTTMLQEEAIALQRYITRYSGCRNERFDGSERIFVNDTDLRSLHRRLMSVWPQPLADYVILVRQYGPTITSRRSRRGGISSESATPSGSGESSTIAIDWSIAGRYQIRSLLELVDSRLTIPTSVNASSSQNKSVLSPFSSRSAEGSNYLIRLLDDCTTDRRKFLEGRIDVWDAPLEVLMSIPDMDEATASRIVSVRSDQTVKQQSAGTLAWLLQRRIVDLPTLQKWEPYVTARSDVYTTQVIGFRDPRSSVYRCTVAIDGSQIPARTRELKTWHAWDAGFNLNEFVDETE